MGRPSTKPKELRDGYYIEIRNRGSRSGIKIRRDTRQEMEHAAEDYRKVKDVVVLGEVKKGKFIDKK